MSLKNSSLLFILLSLCSFSCGTTIRKILGRETPHESYAEKLDDRGLDKTPEGRAWLAASKAALEAPLTVALPYRVQGFFHADKPRALGLQFAARQGERLTFTLTRKGNRLPIYADIFKMGETSSSLLSVDTSTASFHFDAEATGDYLLRLQPELFHTGEFSLSVAVGPSLDFPVTGKASIGSVWGDAREGGKRSHEGIDIFAPKLTPVIAVADGLVTGVREGGIGGKVVWLRPEGKAFTLYYAHLDQQHVQEGQRVKKGDVIGLVGNTGNARTTAAHLHFGVYGQGGAIDPLPFVSRTVKTAPVFADKKLAVQLLLKKAQKRADGTAVNAATYLVPLAATNAGYLAEAPDGGLLQVPFSAVQVTTVAVKKKDSVATATPAAVIKKS